MVTRQQSHHVIDCLPESVLGTSSQAFLDFLEKGNPILDAVITAPEDDEPETEEERAAISEAWAETESGVRLIPDEELARESGL